MSRELFVVCALGTLYLLWILLPLVPAVLIYVLVPGNTITVQGPLAGLKVNASGAFAVFASFAFVGVDRAQNTIGAFMRPTWLVEAKVRLLDANGQDADQDDERLKTVTLELEPKLETITSGSISVTVPENESGLPSLVLAVPHFGGKTVNLNDLINGGADVDSMKRRSGCGSRSESKQ